MVFDRHTLADMPGMAKGALDYVYGLWAGEKAVRHLFDNFSKITTNVCISLNHCENIDTLV